jgi:hyaluronoglucosaminidase
MVSVEQRCRAAVEETEDDVRGLIEGFYGTPWSWDERIEIGQVLGAAGMDTYVYAPKDDPLHRQRWREPYAEADLESFERLASEQPLRVGFSVSPGLSIDPGDTADRAALLTKFEQLVERGVSLVGVLFDDLDPAPGLGAAHGSVTRWLRERLDPGVELFMVPLHYTGVSGSAYLRELDAQVPSDVTIGWTGRYVVNDTIEAAEAAAWSTAMSGRKPLLWDNTPVNDVLMAQHLFTGPLRGRDPSLPAVLSGYLANPMVQARASRPALLSAAAWLRGDDPISAWQDAVGDDRVLMEGCDGQAPALLAAAAVAGDTSAAAELEAWCGAAEQYEAGELGPGVQPWVDQLRAEASVAKVACQLLRMDVDEARRTAPLLYVMWPGVRNSPVQVLGGRGSLMPALGQDEHSRWVAAADSYRPPASVTDQLVEAVFARLA